MSAFPTWQADKLRKYVDNQIPSPILVMDLCALVGLSEAHFVRSFRDTFGMSAQAFVVRRRLELAARSMLQSDAPLSEIALRYGFVDQVRFSNQFREATGLTPAAWRRLRRTQELHQAAVNATEIR